MVSFMVFSFDRKRGSASVRRWKNWALSVAGSALPTLAGGLWICGDDPDVIRDHFTPIRVHKCAGASLRAINGLAVSTGQPDQRLATSEPDARWAFAQGLVATG